MMPACGDCETTWPSGTASSKASADRARRQPVLDQEGDGLLLPSGRSGRARPRRRARTTVTVTWPPSGSSVSAAGSCSTTVPGISLRVLDRLGGDDHHEPDALDGRLGFRDRQVDDVGNDDQLGRGRGRRALVAVAAAEAAEQEEDQGAGGDEDADAEESGQPRPPIGVLLFEVILVGTCGRRPEVTPTAGGGVPTTVGSGAAMAAPTTAAPTTAGAAMPACRPDRKRPSASEKAPADPKRWAGSRASALRTMPSSAGLTSTRIDDGAGGSSVRRAMATAPAVSPVQTGRPVSISERTRPSGVDVGGGGHVLAPGLLGAEVADAAKGLRRAASAAPPRGRGRCRSRRP